MPHFNINGTDIFYQEEGSGEETLVFAHGLLFSSEMFRNQIDHFKAHYHCISFDFKGQGKSGVSSHGYDMDTLTQETLLILEHLKVKKFHFIGLSMGGFIGMRLALRNSHMLSSLIMLNTTAEEEPKENIPKYNKLNFVGRWFGLGLVANKILPIVFSLDFLNDPEKTAEKIKWKKYISSNHRKGISLAVKGVIQRKGVIDEINKIRVPTLILAGEKDTATVPSKSVKMNELISGSELVTISGAGHSSTIENPQEVILSMEKFLQRVCLQV